MRRNNNTNIFTLGKEKGFYDQNDFVITGKVTEHLANNTLAFVLNEDFYAYQNGAYKKMQEAQVKGYIQDILKPKSRKTSDISSIYKSLMYHTLLYTTDKDVNANTEIINLKNGYYNLEKQQFEEGHNPGILSSIQIDSSYYSNYSPEQHPTWTEFLNFALRDLELQTVLQEIMGYCLTNSNEAKKFFILKGVSNSGKSKVIELLSKLVGLENTSHVPLQELHGFHLANIYQKILNVFADLPSKPITNENLIKVMTGEDIVYANRKFKTPLEFENKAKMLFSTNHMPRNLGDDAEAFYKRVIIIPFNYAKEDKDLDPKLMDKLLSEKDAIFMWMLEGAQRLYNNRFKFTNSAIVENEVRNYKKDNSLVENFVKEKCEVGLDYYVSTVLLYKEFEKYCLAEGLLKNEISTRNKFYSSLAEYCGCTYGENVKKNNVRVMSGIKIK